MTANASGKFVPLQSNRLKSDLLKRERKCERERERERERENVREGKREKKSFPQRMFCYKKSLFVIAENWDKKIANKPREKFH